MQGVPAVIAAAIVSLIAHFALGAAKSTHHSKVRGFGMEMTIVGAVKARSLTALALMLGKGGM